LSSSSLTNGLAAPQLQSDSGVGDRQNSQRYGVSDGQQQYRITARQQQTNANKQNITIIIKWCKNTGKRKNKDYDLPIVAC